MICDPSLALLLAAAQRGDTFDVLICDVNTSKHQHIELAQQIKADSTLASIKLVLMTTLGRRGDAQIAKEAGFSGYLTKPIHERQLYKALCLVMGQPLESHRDGEGVELEVAHRLDEPRDVGARQQGVEAQRHEPLELVAVRLVPHR